MMLKSFNQVAETFPQTRNMVRWFVFPLLALCFILSPLAVRAEDPCAMVYGSNWGLMFATPENMYSACPRGADMVVALWPKGFSWKDAPGRIYVTVSNKDGFSLQQFMDKELADFRKNLPNLKVQDAEPIMLPSQKQALVKQLSGDIYGNHELVAYADIGEVYIIAVLTSGKPEIFEELRPAFKNFVASIGIVNVSINGGEVPAPR